MRASDQPQRRTRTWLVVGACFAAATLASTALWPAGRTRLLFFGFLAFALLLGGLTLPIRKRLYLTPLGDLHNWTVAHMVLGTVLLLVVALHAGCKNFGTQGWALVGLVVAQFLSGCWGWVELRVTPRRYARFANDDFMFPSAVRRRLVVLRNGIDRALERRSSEFGDWCRSHYQEVLDGITDEMPACTGYPEADGRYATDMHQQVTEVARLRVALRKLEDVERVSTRWLDMHVPLTVALLLLVVLHAWGWVYYG